MRVLPLYSFFWLTLSTVIVFALGMNLGASSSHLRGDPRPKMPRVTMEDEFRFTWTKDVVYGQGLSCTPGPERYEDCKPMNLTLDVFEPEEVTKGPPRPAVIVVHGGANSGGDNRGEFLIKSQFFASRGFVAFSINYRVSTDFGLYPCNEGHCMNESFTCEDIEPWDKRFCSFYPAVRDFKAAIRWIRASAVQYNVDKERLVGVGSSAGGANMLSAAVATESSYKLELAEEDSTLQSTNLDESSVVQVMYLQWPSARLIPLMEKRFPGSKMLHTDMPPTMVFHGTADDVCDVERVKDLKSEFDALAVPFELHTLEGCQHKSYCAPLDDGTTCPMVLSGGRAGEDGCWCGTRGYCMAQEVYAMPFILKHLGLEVSTSSGTQGDETSFAGQQVKYFQATAVEQYMPRSPHRSS